MFRFDSQEESIDISHVASVTVDAGLLFSDVPIERYQGARFPVPGLPTR